jgi:hypothetical protein
MTAKALLGTTVAVVVLLVGAARADQKADRAAIATSLTQLSTNAGTLAKAAKASDDRGARKKFGPAAAELSDDLAALAKRLGKDVAMKSIATDAAAIDKDASALVELADEAEDKEERKSLRSQATMIQQGIAAARKAMDAVKDDAAPSAPQKFTGRLVNNSDSCSWAENLKFVVSRDGAQVFATQNMVFPGKDFALVLEKGKYLVQLHDTSGKFLGQGTLDASKEGWIYKSGCVNQD